MLITIDDYYSVDAYNEALQALKNNGVDYTEYILTKAPYNFYIDLPTPPVMTNYDELSNSMAKFLINKVEPALPNEEYLLQRRSSNVGKSGLKLLGLNKPLQQADSSDYACFFDVKSREKATMLSKELGEIYYFGRHYHNKIKLAMCYNKMIKNFVDLSDILVEKESSAIQMELDLNWKVFKLSERLRKFTSTPKFLDGKFVPVKIKQFDFTI